MASPTVTIMIPTYEQAAFIGQAVASALEQTYRPIEVLIADDNSPDATYDAVRAYLNDPRVRYFRNQENLGRVGNYRETLYQRATGDWVVNLDGDDYFIDPQFVAAAMAAVREYADVVLVRAGHVRLHPDGTPVGRPLAKEVECVPGRQYLLATHRRPFAHLTSIYRRELACRIDFYRCDIVGSDAESIFRLMVHGNVVLLPGLAGVWRLHGTNASMKVDIETGMKDLQLVDGPYVHALEMGCPRWSMRRWRRRMIRTKLRNLLYQALSLDDLRSASDLRERMWRAYPFARRVFRHPLAVFRMLTLSHPAVYSALRDLKWRVLHGRKAPEQPWRPGSVG